MELMNTIRNGGVNRSLCVAAFRLRRTWRRMRWRSVGMEFRRVRRAFTLTPSRQFSEFREELLCRGFPGVSLGDAAAGRNRARTGILVVESARERPRGVVGRLGIEEEPRFAHDFAERER